MSEEPHGHSLGPFGLFLLILSGLSLVLLAGLAVLRDNSQTVLILEYADTAIAVAFLLDFAITFVRAPNKWQYFITWGWIDLLSSIPTLPSLRIGRVGRVLRLMRLARGVKAIHVVSDAFARRRRQSTSLAAFLITFLVVTTGSALVLNFENDPASNIKTAGDALWWAVATVTTVGYGDRYPVTSEGRIVGGVLMFCGVGLFSVLAGLVASWLMSPPKPPRRGEEETQN